MNYVSQNPRVPAAQIEDYLEEFEEGMVNTPGVCVHHFLLLVVC